MAKLTLTDINSTVASSLLTTINANNALIETALENTLSRNGTLPNEMNAVLDMDSNRIINLPAATTDTEPVRYAEFNPFVTSLNAAIAAVQAIQVNSAISFIIDGGGILIGPGLKGFLEIPFNCVITQATALADQVGDIVIDVWKDTYANYPPTVADSITAAAPITITASNKSRDAALSGWTKTIAANDILAFNVVSASSITRLTLSLRVTKT